MSEFVKIGDVASVLHLIKKSDIPQKTSVTNDKKTINGVFILSGIILGVIIGNEIYKYMKIVKKKNEK
jgi:hypothetical protein